MFCQSCGNKLEGESKFCKNCGAQVQQQAPSNSSAPYTAPQPFATHSTIDPHQPQYQKTAFKGKQASVGSSGHISFQKGARKKGGFLKKAVLVLVAFFAILIGASVFSSAAPISSLKMASEVDPITNLPITVTSVFAQDAPAFYCSFKANADVGSLVIVEWYYLTNDVFIMDSAYRLQEKSQKLLFELGIPDSGQWPVGDYAVAVYINDELMKTMNFKVK